MVATIVASLHENRARPPKSRTQVYARRFELLLDRWDRSRMVRSRNVVDIEDKLTLLSRLAYRLHVAHRRTFNREDVGSVWNDTLVSKYPDVSLDDVLGELRFGNSVIYPSGAGEFSLGHLSYQEYLCARAVVFGQHSQELLSYFADPWWGQVMVFYAGLAGDIERFIRNLQRRYPLAATRGEVFTAMVREAGYTGSAAREAVADMMAEGFGAEAGSDDEADEF